MGGGPESIPAREQAEEILARVAPRVVHRTFSIARAFAITVDRAGFERLRAEPHVVRIDREAGFELHLDESRAVTDTDAVHLLGYRGQGLTVAVIDSGYDSDHPDLSSSLVAEHCFCTGCCPNGADEQAGVGSAEDDHRHGTHVAGIVTSDGVDAPEGYAPEADVVAVKVLDDNNASCCMSDLVAALDWIAANRSDVDVINASLGSFQLFEGDCDQATATNQAMAQVIDTLRAQGVLLMASAGNQANADQMAAPACVADTIAVGSTYDANVGQYQFGCTDSATTVDQVSCFSNGSTSLDILAPGAPIESSRRGGGTLVFGGTSMASPAVAGCAALLIEARPGITALEVEQALEGSTTVLVDARSQRAHPRLDCREALRIVLPDRDEDGVLDFDDLCPDTADPTNADTDADGLGDVCEACPLDADNDLDGDGVCGDVDNCAAVGNAEQEDADLDGLGDACDACPSDAANDEDADGICGDVDNCPAAANGDQADEDADGAGDACDVCPEDVENDADQDGVCEALDNCPAVANPDGSDTDDDGRGDACDPCPTDPTDDFDGDGVCSVDDNCPTIPNPDGADGDGDGLGDACDACPADPNDDADRDGVCGDVDNCPSTANADQVDGDADGAGDVCDVCPEDAQDDADGDGLCESVDPCPSDPDPGCAPADNGGCACVAAPRPVVPAATLLVFFALGWVTLRPRSSNARGARRPGR